MSTSDSSTTPSEPGGSHAVRGSEAGTSRAADPRSRSPQPQPQPQPQAPRTTGAGGRLLGVLAGFVLTLVALAVMALGMSRILVAAAAGADRFAVEVDAPGIALVTIGALLAGLVAVLAVRTSAVPFTGGLAALLVGAAYLFAPEAAHRETVRLLATEQNTDAVLNMLTVCLLGVPFVVGIVLLASGTAASLVRRRGIAIGTFRAQAGATSGR